MSKDKNINKIKKSLSDKDIKMIKKITFSIILHSLGDTIGFKNGDIEMQIYKNKEKRKNLTESDLESITSENIWEFIKKGGITGYLIIGHMSSDDTISNFSLIESLLSNFKKNKDLYKNMSKILVSNYKKYKKGRYWGNAFEKNINRLEKNMKWNGLEYNFEKYGGSGASMRTQGIGLVYFGKDNRDKLIETSIEISRMTHNSVFGYLGGLTTALFTAFAIENESLKRWPFKLKDLLESDKIDSYIKKSGRGYNEYKKDKKKFIRKLKRYIDDRFTNDGEFKEVRSSQNIPRRIMKLYDMISLEEGDNIDKSLSRGDTPFAGSNGCDSVLIAYDCLSYSKESFEGLVYRSMLHFGDTDTTGSIAAGWWGAYYGDRLIKPELLFEDDKLSPPTKLKKNDKKNKLYYDYMINEQNRYLNSLSRDLEFFDHLLDLSYKLYNKFIYNKFKK